MLFLNESVPESTSDCCRLVDIILHLLADPFLPFVVSIKLMYVTSKCKCLSHLPQDFSEKYWVCNIVCNRECIIWRYQFLSFEIYYTRLSHSISWTLEKRTKSNRSLWRPDVELYGNERQIAITFPKERRYLLPQGRSLACKCEDVRKRLHGISLVNILWPIFICI